MSDREEEVKLLLRKHDYITVIQQIGDGCIITYPHPKLLNDYPRLVEVFTFKRDKEPGLWASTSYDEEGEGERFVAVPEYAIRLYVVCEVAACNNNIPIDPSMMVFVGEDKSEYEDIESVIRSPSSEDEEKKEKFLYRLIIEARNDGFPPEYEKVAETHNVDAGYNLIRKFYA